MISRLKKKTSVVIFLAGLILLGGVGGYFLMYMYRFAPVPGFAVISEVERMVDTSADEPVIFSHHSDGCSSFIEKYYRAYKTSDGDLYLIIKCQADMIFGDNLTYSPIMGDLVNHYSINISVGYVNCIIKSAVYIFIPNIGEVEAIGISFICPIPEIALL